MTPDDWKRAEHADAVRREELRQAREREAAFNALRDAEHWRRHERRERLALAAWIVAPLLALCGLAYLVAYGGPASELSDRATYAAIGLAAVAIGASATRR